MPHIIIISSSVRNNRASHRVALYFKNFLEKDNQNTAEIIDLLLYNFPLFHERLKYLQEVPPDALDFANKIKTSDGVILVTPEYNGGYPASLKNVIDFLYDEWHRKPIAISTVSNGPFGGSQVITSLQFSLWKIRAWVVAAMFPVPMVEKVFDDLGIAFNKEEVDKRATNFIKELLWCIEAKRKMDAPNS